MPILPLSASVVSCRALFWEFLPTGKGIWMLSIQLDNIHWCFSTIFCCLRVCGENWANVAIFSITWKKANLQKEKNETNSQKQLKDGLHRQRKERRRKVFSGEERCGVGGEKEMEKWWEERLIGDYFELWAFSCQMMALLSSELYEPWNSFGNLMLFGVGFIAIRESQLSRNWDGFHLQFCELLFSVLFISQCQKEEPGPLL